MTRDEIRDLIAQAISGATDVGWKLAKRSGVPYYERLADRVLDAFDEHGLGIGDQPVEDWHGKATTP